MAETSRGSEPAVGAPAGDTVGPSGSTASRVEMPARYEDLGRIARGGWGEIRRARDITLDRIVVVKVLAWDHLDSDRVLGRFLNEASITASLEHPGIVPVYDRGVLADGRPWFAMKEVRGATLESILRDGLAGAPDGTTRLRRLVDLFARVCETVGYAHRRAIVHRDLKPANLMVGELGEVLVLDWGIAKKGREDAASIGRAPRAGLETQAGDVLGTVAYMSPEQASGWADRVGPPSDVFALGLTLYEISVNDCAGCDQPDFDPGTCE